MNDQTLTEDLLAGYRAAAQQALDAGRTAIAERNALQRECDRLAAQVEDLKAETRDFKSPPPVFCARCGAPRDNHPYRHPFVPAPITRGEPR